MASFCYKCGTPLNEATVFCPNCGTPVAQNQQAPAANQAPAFNQAPEMYQQQPPVAPAQPAPKPPKAPKVKVQPVSAHAPTATKPNDTIQGYIDKAKANPKSLILPGAIVGGVILVLVVLLIVFSLLGNGSSSPEGAVENYLNARILGDSDAIVNNCPDDYWDFLRKDEKMSKDALDERINEWGSSRSKSSKASYGNNIKIDFEILEEKDLAKARLKAIEKEFSYRYDMKVDVSDAQIVTVEYTVKGSENRERNTTTLCVAEIDGAWYVISYKYYSGTVTAYLIDFI